MLQSGRPSTTQRVSYIPPSLFPPCRWTLLHFPSVFSHFTCSRNSNGRNQFIRFKPLGLLAFCLAHFFFFLTSDAFFLFYFGLVKYYFSLLDFLSNFRFAEVLSWKYREFPYNLSTFYNFLLLGLGFGVAHGVQCVSHIDTLLLTKVHSLHSGSLLYYTLYIVQLLSPVWLFCNPMDCSVSGSSVHGISQARMLEWVATSFFREFSWPRGQTHVSCIVGRFLYHWATREAL